MNQAGRQVTTFGSIGFLGIGSIAITNRVQAAAPGKSCIESVHHRPAQPALIRCLQFEQAEHVTAPILIVAAIANHAHRMRLTEHFGQRGDIPKIVL